MFKQPINLFFFFVLKKLEILYYTKRSKSSGTVITKIDFQSLKNQLNVILMIEITNLIDEPFSILEPKINFVMSNS